MVGIVIVSHSAKVAEGIKEMVMQMARPDQRIIAAGGMEDGGIGTDAMKIQAAIESADDGTGVLVLVDLGSAVLSTDVALELVNPQLQQRVRVADTPILEGAISAAVEASLGSSLDMVVTTAEGARKLQKL